MGYDVKGILYYGIELGTDDPMDGEEECDYHGANEKWESLNRPKEPDVVGYSGPEWDEWRSKLKAYEATPKHVEIDWSGSDESETYYIHCPCYEMTVEWGEQLDLGSDILLRQLSAADEAIKEFCDKFGIEFKKPSWHLAARYF